MTRADHRTDALHWEGMYRTCKAEHERDQRATEKIVRERERAIELLLDIVWNTTSNEVDDPHWRAAKKWLEQRGEWRKP